MPQYALASGSAVYISVGLNARKVLINSDVRCRSESSFIDRYPDLELILYVYLHV